MNHSVPSISIETIIYRNDKIVSSLLDNEIVMMNLDKGKYYHLNAVGTVIWQLLEAGPSSVEAITNKLMQNYEVDKARLEKDILQFVEKGKALGFLTVSEQVCS